MSQSASGAFEHSAGGEHGRRSCSWGKGRWSGWEIAAVVLGFVIFWPVGLIALFWKLIKGELWPGSAAGGAPWANWQGFEKPKWTWAQDSFRQGFRTPTGNSAFEEYRRRELEKLEQLRRKLDEDQKAFAEFVERVRRAKDQEEFDRFMAERNAAPPPAQTV